MTRASAPAAKQGNFAALPLNKQRRQGDDVVEDDHCDEDHHDEHGQFREKQPPVVVVQNGVESGELPVCEE